MQSLPESIVLDPLDRELLMILRQHPRCSMTELARRAGIARGTANARLARLESSGVVLGYGPDIDASRVGFRVTAFTTLEISQDTLATTVSHLLAIPEVLEVHTVTGTGDLLCRIVARTNDHLHDVIQKIVAIPTVAKSSSDLCLTTAFRRDVVDLVTG